MRPGRTCSLLWVAVDGPVSTYEQFASGTIRDAAQRGMDAGNLVDIEGETDKSCKNDWEGS